jgi:uncharacterized membrane protein
VGFYDEGTAESFHGFLRDKRGRFRRIDVPGAKGTAAFRINDHGQIVGYYSDTRANPDFAPDARGFLLDRGRLTRIAVPGASGTQPLGIDNHGRIVGDYIDGRGVHGFVRDRNGNFTKFDVPGAVFTDPLDINDKGQTAGTYVDGDGRVRGFLRDRSGRITTIDVPGAQQTRIRGINNRGQIAIDAIIDLRHHSVVKTGDRFTEIFPPGAPAGSAAGDVDDRGRIIGGIL